MNGWLMIGYALYIMFIINGLISFRGSGFRVSPWGVLPFDCV